MKLRTLVFAALMGGAALAPAHAVTTVSTVGLTTTYFENFNGGTDFATAGWWNAPLTSDDYLWLSSLAPVATFAFSSATAIASLDLSFWYSAPGSANGNVTLATLNSNLPGTNPLSFVLNNPGLGGLATADSHFSTTLFNLNSGSYSLTFSKIGGLSHSMKVDDVSITVTAVPEPETYALLLAGLGVVGFVARRRRPNRD